MAEKGKYHGQRLKAKDVLRLYAAGERDFRGVNLRGQNFRGADLSEADFSGADIRSARFVDTTLRGVRFCGATGGLQRRWLVVQLLMVLLIAAVSGFLQALFGDLFAKFFFNTLSLQSIISTFVYLAFSYQGFTLKAFSSIAVANAIAFIIATIFAVTGNELLAIAVAFSNTGAISGAVVGTVAFTIAGNFVGILAIFTAFISAITFSLIESSASLVRISSSTFTFSLASIVAIASLFLSIYLNKHVYQQDPKFEHLRTINLVFSAIGGTGFNGADLTNAFFSNASLKSTIFTNSRRQETLLHHVRWYNATKLNRAYFGGSSLRDLQVCTLLTTLNGNNADLSHANLEGVNLAGAQLRNANLCGANLSRASLHSAQLHQANLTEAQCIGTNFTATQLTGATLEAWNIDDTTTFTNIDCDFVFLKEHADARGSRERLPHNADKIFAPGDFEKYFKEVMDEVKLLIRGGVDPQAFKTAFQALIRNHDIAPANVHSFEHKGSDVLIRVAVPVDQVKGDIARTFDTNYEKALLESTAQKLLEAEKRSKQEIIQLANKSIDSISTVLSNLTINTTAMTNSNNPNVSDGSFYAGGDVNLTGSTLNLGEISGQVTNQINQLPEPQSDQPSLKDLLTQLQTAIDQDTELNDDEKAEALAEVAKLAKAGAAPKESKMQNLAKRATTTLKSLAETLTDTSKLATACKTLLPMILTLF
ncbi:MAG: pentapeptide repeat-containing protein [Cyanobacteria bacterium P01_D01_bin.156]